MSSLTPRFDQITPNLAINGNAKLWQRGSSFSVAAGNSQYGPDRFHVQNNSTSTVTFSQSTTVPTLAQSLVQSVYSMSVVNATAVTTGASNFLFFKYKMEGYDLTEIFGRNIRVQFLVYTTVPGIYPVALTNGLSGTSARSYVTTFSVNAANTFQKVALDIPMDTIGTWAFNNSLGLQVVHGLSVGSTYQTSVLNTWQSNEYYGYTGQVQFSATASAAYLVSQFAIYPGNFTQAGSATVDIPYLPAGRTFAHEFQMACRYYFNSNAASGSFASVAGGYINMPYPTPLRAAPNSFFVASGSPGSPAPITANVNVTGVYAGQFVAQAQNSAASTLGFSYTVDAEL